MPNTTLPLRRMTSVADVEAAVGRPGPAIMMKQLDHLDNGCVDILAHCPIAGCGYRIADGTRHSTFAGGAPGFMHVRSPTRISFALPAGAPEPAHGEGISFVFLLPGVGETLRLNGSVAAIEGGETVVDVLEVYVHCGRCVLRSKLRQPRPVRSAPGREPGPGSARGPLDEPGIAEFLTRAPFLVVATGDSDGGSDTSPRGDGPGFVRVVDGRTLVLPDRRGNKRADTFRNLLQDPSVALAVLVPGRTDILHLRGTGSLTDDAELLETMSLRGNVPQAAVLIDVEHAELVHSEAVAGARLWSPESHVDRQEVPDLMTLASRHAALNTTNVAGAPPGFLLRPATKLPKLLRFVINLSYRSQLRDEGYEEAPTTSRWQRLLGRRAEQTGPPALRNVRVSEVRRETPHALTVVLEDGAGFDFRPGQFFTLITDIDGRPVRRAYSASSVPGSKRLEVTVKHVEDGRFSGHVHEQLKAGDRLSVRGPSGSFHADSRAELVLVAAGSGITPMMSIIRTRLARPGGGRISLLYASRSEDEIIFAAELARLQRRHRKRLRVTHVLSRPGTGWAGERGRIDADLLRRWIGTTAPSAEYFTCGPEPVMDAVRAVVTSRGVAAEQFHEERYTSVGDLADASTEPQEMVVEEEGGEVGVVTVEPGDTLLDAGLAAGLPMPYSCTVGNCGECMVKLRKGDVTMKQPNCLTAQQQAEGYVLACVGCPRSAVVVEIGED
ncbi:2Fe-2S iron-sulfur cluster-binding protein [Amycolatopsis jejuensis]|uniref:pyridoxamine 5'-phosphate oxidase family protein n=1 Tax=Amycolatopsis jejuensis TaxID=330084 RepID=UPI000524AF3E|nr:2Fe-2S iron-sulfur cluster-binding protein [Amycolatopsis jejuensis]